MTRLCTGGRIEVICGCMYSGKTEELIRRMRQVMIARQPCRIFTPRRDTRYSVGHVASHTGAKLEAYPVSSIHEVLAAADDVQVAAIDELHFLEDRPEEILAGCQALADRGLRVLVAGLDQSYRAEPFPGMMQLMAVAEQVDKLYAICVRCGAYATRSQRLIDGRPAPADAATLVVGGLELYEARCRACYEPAC
ncbi:thymidine kinase [Candidatus Viridilinea mediisalina]|uniref:Thymidine kinase n=1 Tax=Candidatus Viridilinea mediisalina TaxID=2024553 RepID=A0A2A6RIP5_9CHLR|nr:thymidine kinase [Candidatus Viridilinea mediisalina]PDW02766.1 thymidine kinase [Candidatus Viridilinea mediisalina]